MKKIILGIILLGVLLISGCSGTSSKITECTKACAGEDYDIPVYRTEWRNTCSQIYYYAGEEALDEMIADCKNPS